MRIYLPSGMLLDIIQQENGDNVVNVIAINKEYDSVEEFVRGEYEAMYEILSTLKKHGIIGGGSSVKKLVHPKHSKKHTQQVNQASLPTQYRVGLDGQVYWVNPSAPPVNEYTWNPPTEEAPAAPPPTTTYGITPAAATEPSQSIVPPSDKAFSRPINPQASTYIAPVYHAPMLKPGEILTDMQMADAMFPANNESVQVKFGGHIGSEGFDPVNGDVELNKLPEEQNSNIVQTNYPETGFDIGFLAYKNTITDKTIWQKMHWTDPKTGKDQVSDFPTTLREEITFKAAGTEDLRGVIETRNVYIVGYTDNGYDVYDKLVVSQHRAGIEIPLEIKTDLSKNADATAGFTISFDFPWIDNPIPKHVDKERPTIDRGE
jgi:hypothetical protein